MIACGLLHSPRVLIFDEPLTGLDPLGIRKMKATIRQRAESGASIVLSSHLLPLVEELCDSILVISRGKKLASGSLAQIKALSRDEAEADDRLRPPAFTARTHLRRATHRARSARHS